MKKVKNLLTGKESLLISFIKRIKNSNRKIYKIYKYAIHKSKISSILMVGLVCEI